MPLNPLHQLKSTPLHPLLIADEGIVLEKTENEFESDGVLNPTCIEKDGFTHMFYRAVKPGNRSSIGYAKLKNGKVVERSDKPILFPEYEYEKQGVEDPRIVLLEGVYYLFYTAYDGKNALVAYATSTDLVHFQKHGTITPTIPYEDVRWLFRQFRQTPHYELYANYRDRDVAIGKDSYLWEKDAFIFPKKFNNKFLLVHRILPGIQVIAFESFKELTNEFWIDYLKNMVPDILMDPYFPFEDKIGGGSVPIETEAGWLFIYHAVEQGLFRKTYRACAALLDLHNPRKVIARLPYPLFAPTAKWERRGSVSNVVFPSGSVVSNGRLYIYYGAADSIIGCKSINVSELLKELLRHPFHAE